jgi:hypothetical protein
MYIICEVVSLGFEFCAHPSRYGLSYVCLRVTSSYRIGSAVKYADLQTAMPRHMSETVF